MIEAANDRLNAAERCLSESDYAGAIREAQACVELSIKALSKALGLTYEREHDVSNEIPKIIDGLKTVLEGDEVIVARNRLIPKVVCVKILAAVKDLAKYGEKNRAREPMLSSLGIRS